jgi:hypothetical protein
MRGTFVDEEKKTDWEKDEDTRAWTRNELYKEEA